MTHRSASLSALLVAASLAIPAVGSAERVYWDDSVPPTWNGQWPAELGTVAERSRFTRTISTLQLHALLLVARDLDGFVGCW